MTARSAGELTAEIARYEKYRLAHAWAETSGKFGGNAAGIRLQTQRFALWFAESDWDDPAGAWADWRIKR